MFKMKNESKSGDMSTVIKPFSKIMNRINSANVASTNINSFNTQQSPKIVSGRMRQKPNMPFSLIDVPIGKFSRGTNLPVQYVRRDDAELEILMDSWRTNQNNENAKKEKIPDEKSLSKTFAEEDKNEDVKVSKKLERNIKTATTFGTNRLNKFTQEFPSTNNNPWSKNKTSSNINFFNTTDKFVPHNYREYERLIKTAHSQRRNIMSNVSEFSNEDQKNKIFFVNKDENLYVSNKKNEKKMKTENFLDHQESDIFMIKNNKTALDKNGEKYLNGGQRKTLFNVSSKSNSEWEPKNSYPSLLNHSSSNFHILNPSIKNISKTKEQIIQESNGINPMHRQKSLCEYIDLTHVGVPNPNKEFLLALNNSSKAFARNSNICSSYLDIHRLYKDISDRPFAKKLV